MKTEERLVKDALKENAVRRERACSAYEEGRRDARKAAEAEVARLKAIIALETGRKIARYRGGRNVDVAEMERTASAKFCSRRPSSPSWGWPSSVLGR